MVGMPPRRAPGARPPPLPSERRRCSRVCLGEPPAVLRWLDYAALACARNASRSIPLLGGPDEPAVVGFPSDPFISAARMAARVSSSSAESETYLCASSTKPIICPCASPRRLAEDVPHLNNPAWLTKKGQGTAFSLPV